MLTSTFFSGRLLRPCPSPSKSLPHLPSWRTYPTTLDSPFHAIDSLSLSLSDSIFPPIFIPNPSNTSDTSRPFFPLFSANFLSKMQSKYEHDRFISKPKRKLTQWPNWWLGFCTDHFSVCKTSRNQVNQFTEVSPFWRKRVNVWEYLCVCVCARFPKCCRFSVVLHQRVDHHQHQRLLWRSSRMKD